MVKSYKYCDLMILISQQKGIEKRPQPLRYGGRIQLIAATASYHNARLRRPCHYRPFSSAKWRRAASKRHRAPSFSERKVCFERLFPIVGGLRLALPRHLNGSLTDKFQLQVGCTSLSEGKIRHHRKFEQEVPDKMSQTGLITKNSASPTDLNISVHRLAAANFMLLALGTDSRQTGRAYSFGPSIKVCSGKVNGRGRGANLLRHGWLTAKSICLLKFQTLLLRF
jgi:hypothetical protein